jgi:hypothetical protein
MNTVGVTRPLTNPGVIVCRNLPLIYLTIPKSACTTIKNLLYWLDTGQVFAQPLAIHKMMRDGLLPDTFVPMGEDCDSFIRHRRVSFTFVRNPLSRVYSCFNDKVFHQSPHSFGWLRKRLINDYGMAFDDVERGYSSSEHSDNFKRFLFFVRDNIAGKTSAKLDGHWLPQAGIIRRYSKLMNIDVIGKVESYESDIDVVLNRIGIADRENLRKFKLNDGTPAPFTVDSVVTDEIRELVAEIYAGDYSMLGYRLP